MSVVIQKIVRRELFLQAIVLTVRARSLPGHRPEYLRRWNRVKLPSLKFNLAKKIIQRPAFTQSLL